MHDPDDSLKLDEHLARLLAAYDQAIDGPPDGSPTLNVPTANLRAASQPVSDSTNLETLDEPFLDPGQIVSVQAPKSGKFTLSGITHRVGRFELRRQLGKGGCGIVFLAYDPKLEREVALKVPRPEMLLSEDARRRLVREALAAAEFDHPNLVPVYESGEIGPVCFIATAFCPGQTLSEWLDRQAFPVPMRQAARLIATIAEAVQHAHDRGVLHRDLKPNNVILQATKDDPNEQEPPPGSVQLRGDQFIPRIVDFGLAKLLERGGPSETTTRQILGTPKYMAPEQAQARRDDIGPAADIYALGVILYELITGRAPYDGETDVEVLRQSIEGNLVAPRHLRKDVPRDLEAICLKAMHRIPGKRYRTAIDLADDLRRFLDDKPTLARPLKWPGRAARWLRRNDQAVALVVVTTIATVLLAVGSWNVVQTQKLKSGYDDAMHRQAERTRGDQHRDYAKAVQAAFLAWRSGDRKAAEDYLDTAARLGRIGGQGTDFAFNYLSRLVATERLMIVCPAGAVTSLAVSADGNRLVSGHANGTLTVWDRATGEQLSSVQAHEQAVTHIAFALGDKRLFSVGGMAKTTETGLGWAVNQAGQLTAAPEPHRVLGRDVCCLAVSPDGNVVYAGTVKGDLLERRLAGMGGVRTVSMIRNECVSAVVASRDGTCVFVGTGNGKVLRVSTKPAADDWEQKFTDHVTALSDLGRGEWPAIGARGGLLLPGIDGGSGLGTAGTVRWIADAEQALLFNGAPGRLALRFGRWGELPTGDIGEVTAGALAPDRKTLFTGGEDGVIRSWEVPTDLRERGVANVANVTAVGIHPETSWVSVADGKSLMWQFGTKDELRGPGRFVALRVVTEGGIEGTTLGVELRDRAAVVREPNSIAEKARFTPPDNATATAVDLSPDCLTLAVGDDRGRVFVWNVAAGNLLGSVDSATKKPIRRVALTPDGNTVAAAVADNVGVWTVSDAKPLASIPADDQTVMAFFPNSSRLALAGRAGLVRVWNLIDGREEYTLYGHVGRVTAVGVSPDNRTLVSGGVTGEVKFWDLRTGLELLGVRRHTGAVAVVEFSGNGKLLVTAGTQVAIWNAFKE